MPELRTFTSTSVETPTKPPATVDLAFTRSAPFVVFILILASVVGCGSENDTPETYASGADVSGASGPFLVAAGDIADCYSRADWATARLVADIEGTVVTLGDEAYPQGTADEFADCYHPIWGRFKERTKPVPGNHEYLTPGASGYYDYFGDLAGDPDEGYYSYGRGDWHVVALNSNCEKIGGCGESSPQVRWLKEDLAANSTKCTLAYFHHPRFTSGEYRPGIRKVGPFWEALYEANADVVLSAHDHNYQRFVPQNPAGKVDLRRGISQFVVGTGGAEDLYDIEAPLKNVAAYTDDTYGVLRIELRPESYKWRFVGVKWWLVDVKWWFVGAVGEEFEDFGTARCH